MEERFYGSFVISINDVFIYNSYIMVDIEVGEILAKDEKYVKSHFKEYEASIEYEVPLEDDKD